MPTTITISEFQPSPGECNFLGTTVKLRRYYDQDWTDADGVFHAEGVVGSSTGFFDEINCTLSANTITVPAFSATPTDNPLVGINVRETWQLWDQAGSPRNVIFEGFIPSANPTITFGALRILNFAQTLFESDAITRLDQWIRSYIDAVVGVLRFATSVIAGWVRLSVPAANPADPVAVGDNDPRVPTQGENDALVGTSGTPSSTNRFVTNADPRVVLVSRLTQTYTFNELNCVTSPWTWRTSSSDYIETSHGGAYVKTFFTGTSAILHYDPAPLVAASVLAPDYPKLKWRVDGGSWQTAQLTSGATTVSLASALIDPDPHFLELFVMAVQSYNDRWLRPDEVVRLTGLEIAGVLIAPLSYSPKVLFYGDSITEGLDALAAHTPPQVADHDAVASFVSLLGSQLSIEYGNFGLGGLGWAKAITSNLPNFTSTWKGLDAQHSLLTTAGLYLTQPDAIVIILGTNDSSASNVTANVTSILTAMRVAAPSAKILVVTPFNGSNAAAITTGFNNYQTATPDNKVYIFTGTMSLATTDGIHPSTAGHVTAAANLTTLIVPTIKATAVYNLALSITGAVASASSVYAGPPTNLVAANVNNGERTGRVGDATSTTIPLYWNSAGAAANEWVKVHFPSAVALNRIRPIFAQDAVTTAPNEPTASMTFTNYGAVDYEIQYSTNGSSWTTVTGGNVVGNNLVMPTYNFATLTGVTDIRILYHTGAPATGFAICVELEAYLV